MVRAKMPQLVFNRVHVPPAHCAYCRHSETGSGQIVCIKALPMDAIDCSSWHDARKPSSYFDPREQ